MPIPPGIFDTPFEAKDRGEYVREPLMDITLTQKYSSTAQLLETRAALAILAVLEDIY